MTNKIKKKIFLTILFLTMVSIPTALVWGGVVSSISGGSSYSISGSFGGKIRKIAYCTCPYYPGVVLDVGPPASLKVFVSFYFTKIYKYGMIFNTGPWVLGTNLPGGVCMQYKPPYGCDRDSDNQPKGTAVQIGTSKQTGKIK